MRLVNNKLKKPLYFEERDIKYKENIKSDIDEWSYCKISDIKNSPYLIDKEISCKFAARDITIYKAKGILFTSFDIICIIVNENEKLKAIVNSTYINNNNSHKTFINKFIKSYDIKLKDVEVLPNDTLKEQFNYIYMLDLEDMDEEFQKVLSNKFINEVKLNQYKLVSTYE